jgi:hypothetical protein
MKWPAELLLIRHAESAYNSLRKQKDDDPDYRRFLALLERDPSHPELQPWPSCFTRSTHSVTATAIPQSLRWGKRKLERLEERCGHREFTLPM